MKVCRQSIKKIELAETISEKKKIVTYIAVGSISRSDLSDTLDHYAFINLFDHDRNDQLKNDT